LIGGEPTLHPNFKEIVDYAHSKGMTIYLVTNGSHLKYLDSDTLDKIKSIQISLYGLSKEEYILNTNKDGFNDVISGINRMNYENRDYILSITINESIDCKRLFNFLNMHSIKNVRFGFVFQTKRSKEVSDEERKTIIDNITEIAKDYPNINVIIGSKENILDSEFSSESYFKTITGAPVCEGFASKMCISENGRIKPCTSLPNKYSIPLEYLVEIIENGFTPSRELFDNDIILYDYGCSILKKLCSNK